MKTLPAVASVLSGTLLFALLVSSVSVSACTTTQVTPSGSDGGAAGSDGAATVREVPSLACLQILQCGVDCPENDETCLDACGAKATEEGKSTVLALAACIDKEKCTESTCIQEKCATTLDACIQSSVPKSTGSPLSGDAPPGSVPTNLVGTWAGARDGITQRLILNADGTGSWMTAIASQESSCFNFTRTTRTGNVVVGDVQGNATGEITVYATSVVTSQQRCKPPAEDTNEPAVTEHLKWQRSDSDPNTIFLIDSVCAAKYPGTENCNMAGCPIGLYCTGRLTRE